MGFGMLFASQDDEVGQATAVQETLPIVAKLPALLPGDGEPWARYKKRATEHLRRPETR